MRDVLASRRWPRAEHSPIRAEQSGATFCWPLHHGPSRHGHEPAPNVRVGLLPRDVMAPALPRAGNDACHGANIAGVTVMSIRDRVDPRPYSRRSRAGTAVPRAGCSSGGAARQTLRSVTFVPPSGASTRCVRGRAASEHSGDYLVWCCRRSSKRAARDSRRIAPSRPSGRAAHRPQQRGPPHVTSSSPATAERDRIERPPPWSIAPSA